MSQTNINTLKHGVKTTQPNERMLSLVMVFFALWVMFLSQFLNNTEFTDETSEPRVEDVRDFSSDPNAPPDTGHQFDAYLPSINSFTVLLLVWAASIVCKVFPSIRYLYHIRPRSPPH